MKFIAAHGSTQERLGKWARDKILVLADFYFYSSGSIIQTTRQGLYRSLLCEVLSHWPELIPSVFPSQWKHFEVNLLGDPHMDSMEFADKHIEAAFESLI